MTTITLSHGEEAEVRLALAVQAKKWRRSLISMQRDGRDVEHAALADRYALLQGVRAKLGAVIEEDDQS